MDGNGQPTDANADTDAINRSLQRRVIDYIEEYHLLPEQGRVVVAVSGGADSLCLLHILHMLCGPGKVYAQVQLRVAHLNHLLRPEVSAYEAAEVAALAAAWGLPITVGQVDVPELAHQEQRSLEDAARVARYRFLREVAQGDRIAVAHHQDDQVETLLLHWLRGGGIASMIGLQPQQQDIIRPLLCVTHAETLAYCHWQQLPLIEDASNRDPRFLRNRVRHELLPLLTSMNANIHATLLRNAEVLSVDAAWIEEQVSACWPSVVTEESVDAISVQSEVLLTLPLSLQRHLQRRCTAMLCHGQSPLELCHYHLLERLLADKQSGEERILHLPANLRAIYRRGTLTFKVGTDVSRPLTDVSRPPTAVMLNLSILPNQVEIPNTPWYAQAELLSERVLHEVLAALATEQWDVVWHLLPVTRAMVYIDADRVPETLHIRMRRPGDRIRPLGMTAEKKVKDVLIDAHIPRVEREQVPLFLAHASGRGTQGRDSSRPYVGREQDTQEEWCVWLGGVCLDDRVRLTKQTQRVVRLSLLPREQNQE